MKATLTRLLLLGLLLVSFSIQTYSQTTIGSKEKSETGALLDLKQTPTSNPNANDISSLENSEKGLLHPRVSLKSSTQLTPLYGGVDNGNGNWTDDSTDNEKLLATGMVVYNINPDGDGLEEGLHVWRVDEWISFSGAGPAKFSKVDCSDIDVQGAYVQGIAVTNANYLVIKLEVEKVGSYAIMATSENGYSFYVSGMAVEKGKLEVTVPSQGQPGVEGIDTLTFSGIDVSEGCEVTIEVASALASYSMNCSRTTVYGEYLKGQPLGAGEYITVTLNVYEAGTFFINGPTTNGVRFEATGKLPIGTHQVTLYGSGSPTTNEVFSMDIIGTSSGEDVSCKVEIPVMLPAMTYGIIGSGTWSWGQSARKNALSTGSFAKDGIVRIAAFTEKWAANNTRTAIAHLQEASKPDVILYFAYGSDPNQEISLLLAEYVNAGGSLIYGSSDGTSEHVQTLMSGVFGSEANGTVAPQMSGGSDDIYPIPERSLWEDPIVNGPFGNLSGTYWGEDNTSSNSVIMTSLPFGSVQICTAKGLNKPTQTENTSIIWYNDQKNFVYFGDSTGSATNNTSSGSYPSTYSSGGLPLSKLYGPTSSLERIIYNAALEMNAVAWAVRKAAISGINPH